MQDTKFKVGDRVRLIHTDEIGVLLEEDHFSRSFGMVWKILVPTPNDIGVPSIISEFESIMLRCED